MDGRLAKILDVALASVRWAVERMAAVAPVWVAYVPGNAFYADGFGSRNMRLSYCFPTAERIYEGTRRLGKVIRDELEMRETFGLPATETPHKPVSGPAPDLS